ncbi:MAG: Na+/H+ antiporter NhaC [Emergencia sp.]|jgi:NhaC family Na+:H+ antiporter|uniref:Na+/H+ antiporter NhaC n=1 Tax=Anaerovoracaceae TaxID=543314 RepID=UPI00203B767C|nr:Na+/H+ antiporter NhaC [Senimuribacter intestinalis]MCI9476249.1 Na+/H+ antiporter NhaC [Emergencia sp.]
MEKKIKAPTFLAAISIMIIVVAILMASLLWLNIDIRIALMFAIIVASAYAMFLGYKWDDIQKMMMDGVYSMLIATFILLLIGAVIATWIASGTIPYIIYIGLKIINPKFFLICACIASSFMSIACGSSWSSAGTVGIAFMGIGAGLGINPAFTAGAVVSGSYFGDKMSPFSDTTNLASAMSGVSLFSHMGSMLWTTVPAYIIAIIMYGVLGFTTVAKGTVDESTVNMYLDNLDANFNLSPVCLLPIVVLLVVVIKKAPAIPGLVVSALLGAVMAMILQGTSFVDISNIMYNGYSIESGVADIDRLLNRGGLSSMLWTVALYFFACVLGNILDVTGVLRTVLEKVAGITKRASTLVTATLASSFLMQALTGSLESSMLINSKLFAPAYDDLEIDRKVLSRSLEDTGTMCAALIPWNSNGMYMASTLGVATLSYLPYCFLGWLTPAVALVLAWTGIGIFYKNGKKPAKKAKAN